MLASEGLNNANTVKLEPKEQEEITNLEESVLRMHHGLDHVLYEGQEVLAGYEKRPVKDSIYRKLLEIELRALQKTGRLKPMLRKHKSKIK